MRDAGEKDCMERKERGRRHRDRGFVLLNDASEVEIFLSSARAETSSSGLVPSPVPVIWLMFSDMYEETCRAKLNYANCTTCCSVDSLEDSAPTADLHSDLDDAPSPCGTQGLQRGGT